MENSELNVQTDNSFINKEINDYLLETSKWGKFLAIVGYIFMGLMILLAIFMMVGLSALSKFSSTGFPMGPIGFVYILFAVIYYFPVTYLYKFSVQIKDGLNQKDQPVLTSGFRNLKSLFTFMGILTIVILAIYAIILVVAIPMVIMLK